MVDIGAGKCGVADLVVEQFGAHVDAVDSAPRFMEEAATLAAGAIEAGQLVLHCETAEAFLTPAPTDYDVALCIGSSHALVDYPSALVRLAQVVVPGGAIVMGEGYWKRTPHPDYLAFLGAAEDELRTHAGNVDVALEQGLTPVWAYTTSDDEWDDYEWLYSSSVERYVRDNPSDADAAAMRERIGAWRAQYLEHGRDTLGFGLYAFESTNQ